MSCIASWRAGALEQEKAQGKAGRIATSLLRMNLIIQKPLAHDGEVCWFRK
jgi:hypothetical protein